MEIQTQQKTKKAKRKAKTIAEKVLFLDSLKEHRNNMDDTVKYYKSELNDVVVPRTAYGWIRQEAKLRLAASKLSKIGKVKRLKGGGRRTLLSKNGKR